MGKSDILQKLRDKLRFVPKTEEDIIFVLSRIRKVLEADSHPEKYSILNFYCNLALHTKIDKRIPKALADELKRVHDEQAYTHPFFGYPDLHKDLSKFIEDYGLPNFYDLPDFKGSAFTVLLNSIYSDTPVFVDVITRYKVVVNDDGSVSGEIITDRPSI